MVMDFGDGFVLRHATAGDDALICRVSLLTGNAGQDASGREDDPNLLGLIYCLPYRVLEPDFAFVVDSPDGVCGYLFGAPDTVAFNARLESDWYPSLRNRFQDPGPDRLGWHGSDWARYTVHHPEPVGTDITAAFPSHGHIDLVEQARGRGIGKQAMTFLMQRLAASGSNGLFLDVDPQNHGAREFYRKLGFASLPASKSNPDGRCLARSLPPSRSC